MSTIPTEAKALATSGAGPDWRIPSDDCTVTIDATITIAVPPAELKHKWTPTNKDRIRPEHAARWPESSWLSGAVIKVTALSSAGESQRDQWAAFVRGRRLCKRMKRAQRTTAPDWSHNLRCFVLELQRDPAAVLLTSGCRCPACRTDVRSVVDIDGWPNVNLTRGPGRFTRTQRKAVTLARLRRKSKP